MIKAVPIADAARRPARCRAAVIEDPHIVVVEGTSTANGDAVADALGLLIAWAIRAYTHDHPQPCTAEATSPEDLTAHGPED